MRGKVVEIVEDFSSINFSHGTATDDEYSATSSENQEAEAPSSEKKSEVKATDENLFEEFNTPR